MMAMRSIVQPFGALVFLWASAVQAQTVQCPPSVRLQVKQIAPFAPDGAAGSIRGFAQTFSPRRVRLVGVELGTVRDSELAPSFPLQPDDLMVQLGRRSVWTLWNGLPPAPDGVLHLVCEYEGGLSLNKPVGARIRQCELNTAVQGRATEAVGKSKPQAKGKAAAADKRDKTETAAASDRQSSDTGAATYPVEQAQTRPVIGRAVLTCR